MRVERSAGGVVFRRTPNGTTEILVILDSHDGWAFPKGRIEFSETPVQAARRETLEEVGLSDLRLVQPLGHSQFWFVDRWEQPGEKVHKFIDHFLFETSPDADPQPEPGERVKEAKWVSLQALESVVTYQTLQPIIRRIQQVLAI